MNEVKYLSDSWLPDDSGGGEYQNDCFKIKKLQNGSKERGGKRGVIKRVGRQEGKEGYLFEEKDGRKGDTEFGGDDSFEVLMDEEEEEALGE